MGFGVFEVEPRGTKPGIQVNLDVQPRAETDAAITDGYLAELEAGYRAGSISDYWLLPGGRLVLGRAPTDVQVPMDDRTLNDLWAQLEELAGVAHVHGRGHYGYRRVATDIAEDLEKDHRILNALFGHTPDGTRRKVYQKKEREEIAVKVTHLRRRAGPRTIEGAGGSPPWPEAAEARNSPLQSSSEGHADPASTASAPY